MTYPTELTVLAHIEQTLAESYRKEIDQEENLWRSLPFFAAILSTLLLVGSTFVRYVILHAIEGTARGRL